MKWRSVYIKQHVLKHPLFYQEIPFIKEALYTALVQFYSQQTSLLPKQKIRSTLLVGTEQRFLDMILFPKIKSTSDVRKECKKMLNKFEKCLDILLNTKAIT